MKSNLKREQQSVDDWNARYPAGTRVCVRLDSGEGRETRTRTEALMLGGHTAVVGLQGISGMYLLSRVTALPEVAAAADAGGGGRGQG